MPQMNTKKMQLKKNLLFVISVASFNFVAISCQQSVSDSHKDHEIYWLEEGTIIDGINDKGQALCRVSGKDKKTYSKVVINLLSGEEKIITSPNPKFPLIVSNAINTHETFAGSIQETFPGTKSKATVFFKNSPSIEIRSPNTKSILKPLAINDSNEVVGYSYEKEQSIVPYDSFFETQNTKAFHWSKEKGFVDTHPTINANETRFLDINNSGLILGALLREEK